MSVWTFDNIICERAVQTFFTDHCIWGLKCSSMGLWKSKWGSL